MTDPSDRLRSFEARLAALKHKMEAGLEGRVEELRAAVDRLLGGDEEARREIKRLSHKLRGIAGTYGHQELTDLAGALEQRASISPPPALAKMADAVADEALRIKSDTEPAKVVLSERPPPRPKLADLQAQHGDGPRLRVLAMDDDPNTLRLLRLTLEQVGGFEATLVEAARAALQELADREFDLVVSDAMMPDMNGQEFCEAARALGGHAARVPIVILSAATADELGWKVGAGGATAWLRKPFRPVELVASLKGIIAEHAAAR